MASPMATTWSLPPTTSSRQVASVRPLRTTSPMASRSSWTPASKLILNSTVFRGARRDRTHREVTRRVRQQTDETPVDDAMPFFELDPKRQTHARHAVLAIAECHAQVAADRSRLEELFEFFEMRGMFRRFTHPLVADTFGQRNRHRLGFIAGSRTRPCSDFLASRPRKDVSLPWSFFHIETRSTMLRVTCCLRRS